MKGGRKGWGRERRAHQSMTDGKFIALMEIFIREKENAVVEKRKTHGSALLTREE